MPPNDRRDRVRQGRGRLPGRRHASSRSRTSTTSSSTSPPDDPRADRRGSAALGHAPGLRHDERPADRDDAVHRQGRRQVRRHHRRARAARKAEVQHDRRRPGRLPELRPALRDRARPRDQVVAVDRLQGQPERDPRLERRPDHRDRRDRRGQGSRARAPERRAARHVHDARADGDLGHAREGLARRGEARRDRRPARRRALPADLLPRPRRRRGDRARHLRGLPLRRDPDLQRHADAAGLRRDDPDARGRRRRERRHLRTREGGVSRGQIRARRDLGRLRQGLRDDRRRERRHRDHGRRPLPRRDRGRQGLRADAPDRNADLAAHGRRRDARDPRPPRRLQVVRQPEADGRRGRAAEVDPPRLRRHAQPLVRDLRRRPADLARRARRQRASTSGSTSGAGRRSSSRRRSRPRSRMCAHRRRRSGRETPSSRAAATRPGERYSEFQIRTESLAQNEQAAADERHPPDLRRRVDRGQERLGELRPPDRRGRDLRDPRLAAPDRDLHLAALPAQVRRPGDRQRSSTTS